MALDYQQMKKQYGKAVADEYASVKGNTAGVPAPSTSGYKGNYSYAGSSELASTQQANLAYQEALKKAQGDAQAGYARSKGNKDLFLQAGGQVDENDPWGFYRESAGNQLAQQFGAGSVDPSNMYRDKLQQLSTGKFGAGDPSYDWRFQQGQQAVERSLASKGLLNSGNAAIELQQYGQGAASQEYAAEFQRTMQGLSSVSEQYNSQFSRLSQMAGINLDPTGTDRINAQNFATGAQAVTAIQGNQLDYSSKMANLNQQQSQWNDQLGMAQQYESGLRDTLSSSPQQSGGLRQQASGGYSSYQAPVQSSQVQGGTQFGNGGMAPGNGFVVRT